MKILVLSDSRAMWPREYNWPDVLRSRGHEVYTYIGGVNHWLISIYMMEQHLLDTFPNVIFDVIIVQAGWHEGGPCFWPDSIWQQIVNTKYRRFNPDKLVQKINHNGATKYLYIDREMDSSVFDTFKKHSKNCLFLGMQSLRPPNDLDKDYHLGLGHHYEMLTSNAEFSKYTDFFNFPMEEQWVTTYCKPDGIHYNNNGVDFVVDYIERYMNRAGKTLNSILSNSKKHKSLYEESKRIGSTICSMTKMNDVVLLSIPSNERLMSTFLGCILYGRVPLIIQRPSSKVSEVEFNIKMSELRDKINPSICICSPEHKPIFDKFFNSACNLIPSEDVIETESFDPSGVAFLQLSSGTTGGVKIFSVTHKALIENCSEYGTNIKLDDSSCIVSWLPLYHDMGLISSFLLPIIFNCEFYTIDPFEWLKRPIEILRMIHEKKGTHIWMPNFSFNYLQKINEDDIKGISLDSVEQWISCSEPTHLEYMNSFLNKFSKYGLKNVIQNCYALAENVFAVSQTTELRVISVDGKDFVSCGVPICGVSVLILNDNDEECEVGRVMIKSMSLVSEKVNKYGYYDTGDIGFINDGELFIMGRRNDSFVSYGNNVYPHLIELALTHEEIIPGRIACFPIFDEGTNNVGIVLESNTTDVNTLKMKIAKSIKELYDISPEVFIEKPGFLIKTSSGKISRIRSGKKVQLKIKLLQIINQFLVEREKPLIQYNENTLWSNGLLDSITMIELVMFLETHGYFLKKESLTETSHNIELDYIDNINSIISNLEDVN